MRRHSLHSKTRKAGVSVFNYCYLWERIERHTVLLKTKDSFATELALTDKALTVYISE